MKNPREVEVLLPKSIYRIGKYKVGPDGLEDAGAVDIFFVKGAKNNPDAISQEGVTTESLLSVIKHFIVENNVDQFKSDFNDQMLIKVDEIFSMIDKRNADRAARQVQQTDKG